MAWYKTGTVSVTNASTTVTGSGTNFVSGAQVGEAFQGPDGELYEITVISSATSLTITPAYGGATASGQSYAIVPTQSLVADLASDVADLISDYQTVVDEAGAGKFGDGSAASPSISFVQDQDTGFFRDTANEIAVSIGGTKIGEFNASGLSMTTGINADGGLTFGDNDKAIFGAGSDLQIYHDGTHSYISDVGTGNLRIRGTDITLQDADGNGYISMVDGGAGGTVYLKHLGSNVLSTTSTGIDVTGTVTADGLTVDGTDTEAATSQLLKVRNSTTGEAATIGLYAKADNGGDGNSGSITFDAGADGSAANNELRFSADHQTDTNPALSIKGNGDISFYEDTGTTAKFFWDASAESLGIGTTSPSRVAELYNTSNPALRINNGTDIADIGLASSAGALATSSTSGALVIVRGGENDINLATNGINRVTIDSVGNVGIGVTGPTSIAANYTTLHLDGSSGSGIHLTKTTSGTTATDGSHLFNAGGDFYVSHYEGGNIIFSNGASATERARIDSSGNLLVGKTSASISTAGFQANTGGDTYHVVDGGITAYFNRLTSDGDIAQFRKDGTTVGSIGVATGLLGIGNGTGNLGFYDAQVNPMSTTSGGASDGVVSLGISGRRFKDLYLSGGVYLGGTGASNLLDDYEEGTFSPTFRNVTHTLNSTHTAGKYTKIGNVVNFSLVITTDYLDTSDASDVEIDGLPYTVVNDTAGYAALSIFVESGFNGVGQGYHFLTVQNTDYIRGYEFYEAEQADGNNYATLKYNDLTSGDNATRIRIAGTYHTA